MPLLITIVRLTVLGGFTFSAAVALTHWGVRSRYLQPFGPLPRFMRRVSQPLILPLERRMVKSGHNPSEAPIWLFWISLLGGLLVIGLTQWLIGAFFSLSSAVRSGPSGVLILAIQGAYSLLVVALFIRVVGSWMGLSPYARWMRPVMALTNWLVDPLRRILPPFGMFDLSPLAAYVILYVGQLVLLRLVLQLG
ncbi:MAG TPA: YggT family protein [Gemmatimonadales bacterium]|nr:YggT family protein [Gemmatimonadales bacterium]